MNETEYAKAIICGIVDYPEDVEIESKNDERGVLITIKTNKSDVGKVIGKAGETITAVRKIMNAFGGRSKQRIGISVFDPRKEEGHGF